MSLVPDEGDNHAVEVEEEENQVEAELGERFLLVNIKLPEDLSRVKEVGVVNDLLDVPSEERQVQDQRQPISVDEEQERHESMNGDFGENVGVEAVAEVDRVDVVTFQVAVHDGEEDLKKEVDGIYNDREEV